MQGCALLGRLWKARQFVILLQYCGQGLSWHVRAPRCMMCISYNQCNCLPCRSAELSGGQLSQMPLIQALYGHHSFFLLSSSVGI